MSIRELIANCTTKTIFTPEEKTYYTKGFTIKGKTYEATDKIYKIKHKFLGIEYIFYGIEPLHGECSLYLENMEYTITGPGEYNTEDYLLPYWDISADPKKYCIELIDKVKNNKKEIWINFIQQCSMCNLPSTQKCKGLGGIFGLIHSILTTNKISGSIYLEDDSQYLATCWDPNQPAKIGVPTFLNRLLLGKKTIYEDYSFYPVDDYGNILTYTPYVTEISNKKILYNQTEMTIGNVMQTYFQRLTLENREAYEKLLKIIRDDIELKKSFYGIRMIISRMKNDDINSLKQHCEMTGGSTMKYYNKYKKYKLKYLNLIGSNHQ